MLSLLNEFNESFFNYGRISKYMWDKKVEEARKTFNILFDLENNSSTKKQREIIIPQNQWKDIDCKFRCELWSAGGDWEIPLYYFKCQLIDGYAFNISRYANNDESFFIFIPGKTEGNYHLVRTSKNDGWRVPHNGDEYKKGIDPEPNERDCWKSLEIFLKKLVDLEIQKCQEEKLRESGTNHPADISES